MSAFEVGSTLPPVQSGNADFHPFELVGSLLSMGGSFLVLLTYVLIPVFRRHPSEIILMIAVADFFLALKFFVRSLAWLTSGGSEWAGMSFHLFHDDCMSSVTWSAFFETFTLTWNGVWCFYLFYQLKFPHRSTTKLQPYFFLYTIVVSGATAIFEATRTRGTKDVKGYVFCTIVPSSISEPSHILEMVLLMAHLLMAFVSVGYAYWRLRSIPRSQSMRRLFFRHFAYVFVFFMLWSLERFLGAFSPVASDDSKGYYDHGKVIIIDSLSAEARAHRIAAIFWQAQGFFVAVLRLSEPHVLRRLLAALGFPSRCLRACFKPETSMFTDVYEETRRLMSALEREEEDDLDAQYPIMEDINADAPAQQDDESISPFEASVTSNAWGASSSLCAELQFTDSFGKVRKSSLADMASQRRRAASGPHREDDFDNTPMYGDL